MPNLSIKDVPDAWAQALRQRAARNHRSLQGELMAIVEKAVGEDVAVTADVPGERGRPRIVGYDQRGWPIVRQGWKTPDEVIASLHEAFPQPMAGQLSSIELIRQDRDSR